MSAAEGLSKIMQFLECGFCCGTRQRSASCSSEIFMPDQVSMQINDWQVTCIFFACASGNTTQDSSMLPPV